MDLLISLYVVQAMTADKCLPIAVLGELDSKESD
jgi:hypothetical protein